MKERSRILIVEDESISAMDLEATLVELGYEVVGVCANATDAARVAGEMHPDLVLMDVYIHGEIDGISLAGVITEELHIPIVFLTSYSNSEVIERAKSTNAYGYLIKPFQEESLHSTIQMALSRARVERKLAETRTWLETTLRSIGDGVIATDEHGKVRFMNHVAMLLTGWSEEEAMGEPLSVVFDVHKYSPEKPGLSFSPDQLDTKVARTYHDHLLTNKDGTEYHTDLTSSPIVVENIGYSGTVIAFRDISERKKFEERLEHLAHHDVLTGLPNRLLFMDRLEHNLRQAERTGLLIGILNMDLKDFKPVNDTYGHEVGDLLLRGIAQRMLRTVRRSDTVSRFGGDEFVILLSNVQTVNDAAVVADKILKSLAKPFIFGKIKVNVQANIGIAVCPFDGTNSSELLRRADQNMYRAKQIGNHNYEFSEILQRQQQSTE